MTELDEIMKDYNNGIIDRDEAKRRMAHMQKGSILDSYHLLRSKEGKLIIDTCYAGDVQMFETAIFTKDRNPIIIVDRCEEKADALNMHVFWESIVHWKIENETEPFSIYDITDLDWKEFI